MVSIPLLSQSLFLHEIIDVRKIIHSILLKFNIFIRLFVNINSILNIKFVNKPSI